LCISLQFQLYEARFGRRTLHVPNLIVLDATQERRTKYNVIDKVGAHSPAKPK
jgi:ribosomal protein S16